MPSTYPAGTAPAASTARATTPVDVGGWTGTGTLDGLAGAGDGVKAENDLDFTLADTSLARPGHGTLTLTGIEVAHLPGGGTENVFAVTDWTGTGTLDG